MKIPTGFGSTLRWCPLANSLPQGQAPKHEIEVGSLEWTMVSDQLQRGSGTQQAGRWGFSLVQLCGGCLCSDSDAARANHPQRFGTAIHKQRDTARHGQGTKIHTHIVRFPLDFAGFIGLHIE